MSGVDGVRHDLGSEQASIEAWKLIEGKVILSVSIVSDSLRFLMDDGAAVELLDGNQFCCERRYLTTDDDLSAYIGSTLLAAEVRDVGERDSERGWGDVCECSFLIIKTSMGDFTVKAYNEHNGCYSGIGLFARVVQ